MNWTESIDSENEAYELIRNTQNLIDQVKVHSTLKENVYKVLIEESKKYKKIITGKITF
jgi:hypothetical protein